MRVEQQRWSKGACSNKIKKLLLHQLSDFSGSLLVADGLVVQWIEWKFPKL